MNFFFTRPAAQGAPLEIISTLPTISERWMKGPRQVSRRLLDGTRFPPGRDSSRFRQEEPLARAQAVGALRDLIGRRTFCRSLSCPTN